MKKILSIAAAVVAVMPVFAQQKAGDGRSKIEQENPNVVASFTRFEGTARVAAKGRAPSSFLVAKKNWGIHGRKKLEKFPESGFLIVHLHSGLVTTTINGKEEKRKVGDYWTVPAGSQMSIQVTSESASLETFSIR